MRTTKGFVFRKHEGDGLLLHLDTILPCSIPDCVNATRIAVADRITMGEDSRCWILRPICQACAAIYVAHDGLGKITRVIPPAAFTQEA